ncbi:MAG: hypothetical protein ACP5JG_04990 [Anaerolineae bacterium]
MEDATKLPVKSRAALILFLLLVLFARLTLESRQLSFTTDEPLHISAGYTYVAERATWTTLTRGHPLLVDGFPAPRPLSVMAHLVAGQGEVVDVADGLGVPAGSWREGDTLVQRHHFELGTSLGEDQTDLWLRTGAYWLDTGERWDVGEGRGDAIFVPLQDAP